MGKKNQDEDGFIEVTKRKSKKVFYKPTNPVNTTKGIDTKDAQNYSGNQNQGQQVADTRNQVNKLLVAEQSKQKEQEKAPEKPLILTGSIEEKLNLESVGAKGQKKKQRKKRKKVNAARFLKNMLWDKQKPKQEYARENLDRTEHYKNNKSLDSMEVNKGEIGDDLLDSQGSSSKGEHKGHMSPITADTECLQQKGGRLEIDLGYVKFIPLEDKHGPDIEHNSDQELCYDTSEEQIARISSDEEVPNSFENITAAEEEQILDSLVEVFAPSPRDINDPITQEREQVINQQGLSPRGSKNRKGKNSRKGNKAEQAEKMEPFLQSNKIEKFRRKLGFDHAISNSHSKVWIFWKANIICSVLSKSRQQVTLQVQLQGNADMSWITIVYARSKANKRRHLWQKLRELNYIINGPWIIGGDFNSIMEAEEKKGGVPFRLSNCLDFINCMEDCGMTDAGFTGNIHTWCNGRGGTERIHMRLDRLVYNEEWSTKFQNIHVEHLSKTGSDHNLLLVDCTEDNRQVIKYFKFLNFWTEQEDFLPLVKNVWDTEVYGNPMWRLQQKLKFLAKELSKWSRHSIGDVFEKVKELEKQVSEAETAYLNSDSDIDRMLLNKSKAEYIKWLKMEDSIIRQKARIKWAEDGDSNTKYFHSTIRARRRRAQIFKIKDQQGHWVEGNTDISKAATDYFSEMFSENQRDLNLDFVKDCDNLISQEDNTLLTKIPTAEEIKMAIDSMDPNSCAGPDGFNGFFFQHCWEIIRREVLSFVLSFFHGAELTKFYTHSCLALIPKVTSPDCFSKLRPIILSNFSNKILSKILALRINTILPKIISENQTGFVKGRLITENILLTQEIIHGMRSKSNDCNVVIKLDMSKAYDKLSWNFLTSILRKMGFDDFFINMVYRLISNNWYSVIINGIRFGFFKSSRGLKQGDPLSPALFIIAAETLTRALNYLHHNERFASFSMHKKGPQINHLSYADDLVLFTSADRISIKLIMKQLKLYQRASGQEINKDKTCFLTHSKTDRIYNRRIRRWTGYKQATFPFTYLGCPIYCGRKRISYFSDISKKIINKIAGWQGRFLSPGGKAVIIKHILQSQTLHIFAALMPPVTVLYEIEMQFANFFWGEKDGKNSYHWSSWENMSFPVKEGGLGFKSLLDICHTFTAKRWWRLRTEPSLWAQFLKAKYCQRSNLNSKMIASKDSAAWKDLLHIRDKMEININWRINSGKILFWWDNWTFRGSLYQMINPTPKPRNVMVKHFLHNQQWELDENDPFIPRNILEMIKNIPIGNEREDDKAIWNLNSNGTFSCSTAYEIVRNKNMAPPIYKYIWTKEIPFKISFFMWKLLKKNLPLDAYLSRFNINKGPSCCCCRVACMETGDHVFAASELAKKTWQNITRPLGFTVTANSVQAILWQWWRQKPRSLVHKFLLLITPVIIKVGIGKKFKYIDYTWNWNKNQRKAGAGGIVRNRIGNMIMAFSYPSQFYTNNYSEAQAALIGISWCVNQQFEALEVELDSLLVVQMLNGTLKPPWRIQGIIDEIRAKMTGRNISVQHCYREGNEVADTLAKYAAQVQAPRIFLIEGDLPMEARGPLRMNKLDLPSFRRQVKKNSGWFFEPP
ncbi:uncharacterized protein LOC132617573 [Lycium barbarum]|uniref:uncharacterized protein LOC132617573 n=1 Tax=Lycium barbarum TaxID=112863 RepID=UPI00293F09A6|nr:uncharacterized protein LOC132617573 [Lycium barbarum]